MSGRVIYPPEFFNDPNPEETYTVNDEIEFKEELDPDSQLLIPSRELDFIYTSPRPGLEAIGITIADRRLGSYTLLLAPEAAAYLIENLTIGLNNLETMRLEVGYRHEDRDAE